MNAKEILRRRLPFPWVWWIVVLCALAVLIVPVLTTMTDSGPRYMIAKTKNEVRFLQGFLTMDLEKFEVPSTAGNAEIMAAISAKDPKNPVVWVLEGKRINARGEMLDPWMNPFHIDVSNPKAPTVYSFGKNGVDEGGAVGSDDVVSWR